MTLDGLRSLVAMLAKLPPGPAKASLALRCDALATAFKRLVNDVAGEAKGKK